VRTRLAPPLAVALDLPYPEASSDEIVQRNASHDDVAPRFDGRQIYAFGRQLLQRFGLDKREIVAASTRVGEGPGLTLVAVAQEATSLDRLRRGHRLHGTFGLGGQHDRLDHANAIRTRPGFGPPSRVVLREHESGIHGRVLLLLAQLGQGIVDDAGGHAEKDRPARGVAAEGKEAPRPLEALGGGDGHEAEVPRGEPLAHVGLSFRRHLGDVDVEHVRDARPKRSFFAVIHRSQGATPFHKPLAARTLAVEGRRYKMRRKCRASVAEMIAGLPNRSSTDRPRLSTFYCTT